jgi:hypothetical protein
MGRAADEELTDLDLAGEEDLDADAGGLGEEDLDDDV